MTEDKSAGTSNGPFTTGEIVRWLRRLETSITELIDAQEETRKSHTSWVMGILAAIIILVITDIVRVIF